MITNSSGDSALDRHIKKILTPVQWDQVRHAPLCDDRTNEIICIYLELVRMLASQPNQAIYQPTMEPFWLYAIQRLDKLFHLGIQVTKTPVDPPEQFVDPDSPLPGAMGTGRTHND